MQLSPVEVGAPPEFGNYVVEQTVVKPEVPSYVGGIHTNPSMRSQSSAAPSLTKLNSILDAGHAGAPSAIMSGVSFTRQGGSMENGGLSPRSMKLDQILGARSESTLGRGISVRVGPNSGASPTRTREPQASFQRGAGVPSTGYSPNTATRNASISIQSAAPQPINTGMSNNGPMLQPGGIASSLSFRQLSFSRDGGRSPRAVTRIQSAISFSEELMEKFSRLDVADRCRVGQRLRADVVGHFQDIYTIPAEDILISFELTDAMQLQATFELPSTMDSRTRSTLQFRAKTPVRPELMVNELHKL